MDSKNQIQKREIKFRAWLEGTHENMTIEVPKMEYDILLNNGIYHIEGWGSYTTITIMQFTGLHDKNGKEIYEGDILEDVKLDGNKRFYKVFYKKGGLVINIHQDDFKKDNPLFYEPIADMQTSGFIEQNCIIIGNIYENPELLSGGEK